MNFDLWVGVVGAAVGGGFALGASTVQARSARREGEADRRHSFALAAQQDRARAYVEAARAVHMNSNYRMWVKRRLDGTPLAGDEPPNPVPEWTLVRPLVATFGSLEVLTLVDSLADLWNLYAPAILGQGGGPYGHFTDRQLTEVDNLDHRMAIVEAQFEEAVRGEVFDVRIPER